MSKKPKKWFGLGSWNFWSISAVGLILLMGLFVKIYIIIADYKKSNQVYTIVEEFKRGVDLPAKIDENITLVNIVPEPNAIQTYYLVKNTDSNNIFKDFATNICIKQDLKNLAEQGIDAIYIFLDDTTKKEVFSISFIDDCNY